MTFCKSIIHLEIENKEIFGILQVCSNKNLNTPYSFCWFIITYIYISNLTSLK